VWTCLSALRPWLLVRRNFVWNPAAAIAGGCALVQVRRWIVSHCLEHMSNIMLCASLETLPNCKNGWPWGAYIPPRISVVSTAFFLRCGFVVRVQLLSLLHRVVWSASSLASAGLDKDWCRLSDGSF
jgi:hypothetical protein